MSDTERYKVGDESGVIELSSSVDAAEHALAMVQSSERSLLIVSRDLDPALYDNDAFVDAISALARAHRQSEVWILLQDSTYVVKNGHRLLTLAQRLTSKITIRKPGRDHQGFNEALLIADGVGYIRRPLADRYEGQVDYNAPLRARELTNTFDEIWNHALPDPQLRRLHL